MSESTSAVQDALASVGISDHFTVTDRGLEVVDNPDFEHCESLWETLMTFHKTIQMAMGDAAKYFRQRFGARADQILSERTGWTLETQRNYEWVAEKVPKEVRRLDVLSFSHHQKVASLPPKEQKKFLDRAAEGDENGPWTVSRLAQAVKAGGDVEPTDFYLVVRCKNARDREKLSKELESRGYACKFNERRTQKEAKEVA